MLLSYQDMDTNQETQDKESEITRKDLAQFEYLRSLNTKRPSTLEKINWVLTSDETYSAALERMKTPEMLVDYLVLALEEHPATGDVIIV